VTDACSTVSVTQSPVPGTLLGLGDHVITFTAADAVSNTITCTLTLSVIDTSAPVIVSGPTNMTLSAQTNCTAVAPDLRNQVVATDCSPFTINQSPAPGAALPLGTNTIVLTVTDTNSLSSSTSALITVVDDTPPVIVSCATNRSLSAGLDCQLALPDFTGELTVTDACSTVSVTQAPVPGTLLGLGDHVITFTAADAVSNTITCTLTLSVIDTSAPVIVSGPTNMTLSAQTNCTALAPDLRNQVVATDCSPFSIDQSPAPGAALPLGTNTIVLTVTDTNNLSSGTSALITVVDDTPPVIVSCATNRSLSAGAGCQANLPDFTSELSVTDSCSQFSITQSPTPGTLLGLGDHAITFTVKDTASNAASCAMILSVVLPANANTNISISEFMAKNSIGITDEDGTHSDWIEIRNAGACPINLNNWCLTDDATQLTKWRFPATNIAAGQYIVVWASSKNRRTPGAPLHTNFKMAEEGEYLALVQPDGVTINTEFAPTFPPQFSDISYGLPSNRPTNTYLASPTPGGPNSAATNIIIGTCTTNIIISEFMAKNVTSITDEDGTHSDWIEIYNGSACTQNLNGWSLTDDAANLTKWKFPATNIAGGQYLIVWASNKNRRNVGAPLHTNFKMAEEGEYLALVQPDGVTIATQFSPTFPFQFADVSYGLPPNSTTYSYLEYATPGGTNSPGTNFVVQNLVLRPPRGYYTNSVSVSISTPTDGAVIYYTTNGSPPSPTNGLVYSGRVVLTNTTPLRAAAYKTGFVTANAAHTYVFPYQVVNQTGAGLPTTWGVDEFGQPVHAVYVCNSNVVSDPRWSNQVPTTLLSMPTLSIAMNSDDMFGTNGIYANPFGDGIEWERPCSIEYFQPDDPSQFQINCGIRILGDLSRDPTQTPKHNLRLIFRQDYGADKLRFDLYPGSPVNDFQFLLLHASFNDHWFWQGPLAQMQREQWCADTQRETGGYGTHGRYVNLYIDGLYWGMYNVAERPDAVYGASYLGGQSSEYDALSSDEQRDGGTNNWNDLQNLARAGITNDVAWSNACFYLDMPTFIDYLLINMYGANEDWPSHNYWTVGAVTNGVPFHFFSYDAEELFLTLTKDLTGITDGSPGLFYSSFRQWPDFRLQFADHAQKLLFNDGALTAQRCLDRWMSRAQEIDLGIVAESARWRAVWFPSHILTHDDWTNEQSYLVNTWFPQRTDIFISQLRNAGMFPLLGAPAFSPNGALIVSSVTVSMSAPIGTIYYTINGDDPRLPSGNLSPNALTYSGPVSISSKAHLQARVFYTNTWSALTVADYHVFKQSELQISNILERHDGVMKLDFEGWPGVRYTLLGTTNLQSVTSQPPSSSSWSPITTLYPGEDGTFEWLDTSVTNFPKRFYMLTWP
jgi:hypothetical protein